jgi:hypothetical protein
MTSTSKSHTSRVYHPRDHLNFTVAVQLVHDRVLIIGLYIRQACLAALTRTSATFSGTPTIGTCPASKL